MINDAVNFFREFFPLVDTTYRPFLTKFDPEENDLECDKRIQATLEAVFERYPSKLKSDKTSDMKLEIF